MEKKSGFKECPRCGLRNKLVVTQCDFCGWQFEEPSDEWIDQIRALEKIGTDRGAVTVDEEISKRIQATIIKPDEAEIDDFIGQHERLEPAADRQTEPREARPEAPAPAAAPATEIVSVVPSEDIKEPFVVETPEPPATEQAAEGVEADSGAAIGGVEEFVETMLEGELEETPVTEEPAAEAFPHSVGGLEEAQPLHEEGVSIREEGIEEERIEEPTTRSAFNLSVATVPAIAVVIGAAAYIGVLAYSLFSPLGWVTSWAIVVIGAIMVSYGCTGMYDAWKRPGEARVNMRTLVRRTRAERGREGVDVLICPVCNEVVSDRDDHCPGCGAEFEPLRV